MAENITPDRSEVIAQKAKTVGDENLTPREPEFQVHRDSVDAQVMGKPESAAREVKVHEVSVAMDTVITDTSDPLAVQVPDAGRGALDLPIHRLAGQTAEQFFADNASKDETPDDGLPQSADRPSS